MSIQQVTSCDECGEIIPVTSVFITAGYMALGRVTTNPIEDGYAVNVSFKDKHYCSLDCLVSTVAGAAKHADLLLPKKPPVITED